MNETEMLESLNAQVVSQYGFTRGQLSEVFDRVCDPNDWRGPIGVWCMGEEVLVVVEAIEFFTATKPQVDLNVDTMRYRITSEGYRMGPAGS